MSVCGDGGRGVWVASREPGGVSGTGTRQSPRVARTDEAAQAEAKSRRSRIDEAAHHHSAAAGFRRVSIVHQRTRHHAHLCRACGRLAPASPRVPAGPIPARLPLATCRV